LGVGLAIACRRGDFVGLDGEAWTGRTGLSAARVERDAGEPDSTDGLTVFRIGAGDGAAFSPSACLPLPLFPLLTTSTVAGLLTLTPSLDFIGEGEVAFIDRG
jgi:hypothetical protein